MISITTQPMEVVESAYHGVKGIVDLAKGNDAEARREAARAADNLRGYKRLLSLERSVVDLPILESIAGSVDMSVWAMRVVEGGAMVEASSLLSCTMSIIAAYTAYFHADENDQKVLGKMKNCPTGIGMSLVPTKSTIQPYRLLRRWTAMDAFHGPLRPQMQDERSRRLFHAGIFK